MAQQPQPAGTESNASRVVMDLTADDDDEEEQQPTHQDFVVATPIAANLAYRKLPSSLQSVMPSSAAPAQLPMAPVNTSSSALPSAVSRPPGLQQRAAIPLTSRHLPASLTNTMAERAPPVAAGQSTMPTAGPTPASLPTAMQQLPGISHQAAQSVGMLPGSLPSGMQQVPGALQAMPTAALNPGSVAAGIPPVPGTAPSAPAANVEESREAMQAVVDALSVCSVKPADPPAQSMLVPLLKHQRLALGWMLSREGSTKSGKPLCPDGGLLADDQGLGKTVTTIALLVSNHVEPVRAWRRVHVDLEQPKMKRGKWEAPRGRAAAPQPSAEPSEAAAAPAPTPAAANGSAAPCAVGAGGAAVEVPRGDGPGGGEAGAGGAEVQAPVQPNSCGMAEPAGDQASEVARKADGASADARPAQPQAPPAATAGPAASLPAAAGRTHSGKPPAGTLIVAPTSLLKQWEAEIQSKVHPSQQFNVLLYHGKGRELVTSGSGVAAFSVVVTSYTTLANECASVGSIKGNTELIDLASDDDDEPSGGKKGGKKRKYGESGLLFQVHWQRVVLDEGQVIKNPRTRVAQAAWALAATHRWILSGTPIQNSVNDLYSYFRFLKWAPFDKQVVFKAQIAEAIKFNAEKGYRKLQQILKGVLLRRTKFSKLEGEPILLLPSCRQEQAAIDLDPEERAFYDDLKRQSAAVVSGLRSGASGDAYFHALAHLMRLRQACCHTALVRPKGGGGGKEPTAEEVAAARCLPQEMKVGLLQVLLGPSAQGGCAVCGDVPDDPVATHCRHVLCRACAMMLLSQADAEQPRVPCPACSTLITRMDVHSPAALAATSKSGLTPDLRAAVMDLQRGGGGRTATAQQPSSKIRRLMEVLNLAIRGRPGDASAKADAAAAPPPKAAPMVGRRSKSSAFLAGLAKKAKPPRPAATGAPAPAQAAAAAAAAGGGGHAAARTGSKVIVFSQWTSMLDLVEVALAEAALPFRRLDGTMSLAARDAQLQAFKRDPSVVVLLLSLRAASLGLNLVVANHVVLLDLWWNPSVEDQAIDRTHRIGQTRDVTVTRITVKDSVEERILELQKRKREVMDAAFSDAAAGGANRLTGDDLLFLFS